MIEPDRFPECFASDMTAEPACEPPVHTTEYRVVVRKYGLLIARNWAVDCEQEMQRCTALWNRLVGIEREHRAEYFRITESPEVVAAQAEIERIKQRRDELLARRAEMRKAARSKVKTPELDAAIAALGKELKAAIERARELRRTARDRSRPQLAMLEERRKAAVKLARQQSGLYWGNYNAVCLSYERARQAAIVRGGELKERHRNADRITNQIQGGMTPDELMSGAHNQVRIDPPDPTQSRHPLLTATIYTGRNERGEHVRHTVTWPIVLHRPLPEDARIQEIVVTRRSCAGTWKWEALFLCRMPAARSGDTDGSFACGIDVGWRMTERGLRVASIASERDGIEEIVLPQEMVDRHLSYYELASRRHQDRNEMLLRLEAVMWERATESLRERAQTVLAKRDDKGNLAASGLDLRGLAAEWMRTEFIPELRNELAAWAEDDRRLWLSANGRQRAARARQDYYRCVAKRIVERYRLIGLEKLDMTAMASQAKGRLPPKANRMRVIAAVSELRQAIASAAKREGARIHYHAGKSSFVCHGCGHETAVNDRGEQYYTCGGCGRTHDQDHNAAMILLAAARASAPVTTETPSPLAWQKRLEGKMKKRRGGATDSPNPAT